MAAYRNDYSKEEDLVLWTLHEIRHKMARRTVNPKAINRSAKELIQKRCLKNVKFFKNGGK